MVEPISAAVLAGGQSRRMGRDKALLEWGNQILLEYTVDQIRALEDLADDVFVVGDKPEYHGRGLCIYPDEWPDAGTLGGIATALHQAQHDRVLIVACDMPLLNPQLLEYIIRYPTCADVIIPVLSGERSSQGGRTTYETLHAIYRKSCLPAIESRLETDQYKVIGFFDDVQVERIFASQLREIDPNLQSFMNVNTPEELARARSIVDR